MIKCQPDSDQSVELRLCASLELSLHVDHYAELVLTLAEDGHRKICQSGVENPLSVCAMLTSTLSDDNMGEPYLHLAVQ